MTFSGEKFGLPEDLPADAVAMAGHPGAGDGAANGHRRVEVEPFDRAGPPGAGDGFHDQHPAPDA